jgi:hypothetical protein
LLELAEVGIGREFSFVGMNANGGVNEIVLIGYLDGAIESAWAIARANGDDVRDSSLAGARHDFIAIRVKARAIEMGVGVDEH